MSVNRGSSLVKKGISFKIEEQSVELQKPNPLFGLGSLYIYKNQAGGDYYQFKVWVKSMGRIIKRTTRRTIYEEAVKVALEEYNKIVSSVQLGVSYGTRKLASTIDEYLNDRKRNEVDTGLISPSRISTFKTILKTHLCSFLVSNLHTPSQDILLSNIDKRFFLNYFKYRIDQREEQKLTPLKLNTLRAEMQIINHFITKFCIERMDYMTPNQKPVFQTNVFSQNNKSRLRRGVSVEEWRKIVPTLSGYKFNIKDVIQNDSIYLKMIMKYYYFILGNCSLRTSELRQIRWRDVKIITPNEKEIKSADINKFKYAEVEVQENVSKVKQRRIGYVNQGSGKWFEELRKYTRYRKPEDYVFGSTIGTLIRRETYTTYWKELLRQSNIRTNPQLVSYQLRHFYITQRLLQGIDVYELADICGTSVSFIQKNYADEVRKDRKKLTGRDFKPDNNNYIIKGFE